MKMRWMNRVPVACGLLLASCLVAGAATNGANQDVPGAWQRDAVAYARMMSEVEWTPVADGMPGHPRRADRYFEAGKTYTGVPYSNGGHEGRYIGFDIFLKTFLAAVENPHSILYTKDLRGQRTNSAAYYGTVCSGYTSYALQSAVAIPSRGHVPPHREGIRAVEPQSAQGAEVGDVFFWPGHVEIVTEVTKDADGTVTDVLLEDSWPPTTRTISHTPAEFKALLTAREATLFRITDLDAWRGVGNPDRFLFPNYEEDSSTPTINRVLLLDRGDWVPYRKGQTVAFNVMDRDRQGVKSLVIKRADTVIESIQLDGVGIIERAFSVCGDYTAHCVMKNGTPSQACEFSVCALESGPVAQKAGLNQPWTVEFSAENMNVFLLRIRRPAIGDSYTAPYYLWLTDEGRRRNSVVVPADVLPETGEFSFSVEGETDTVGSGIGIRLPSSTKTRACGDPGNGCPA